MRPESLGLLLDMRNAARYVATDTAGVTYDAFVDDQRLRQSVLYSVMVIGGAQNGLRRRDAELARDISGIDEVVSMRHVLIHG